MGKRLSGGGVITTWGNPTRLEVSGGGRPSGDESIICQVRVGEVQISFGAAADASQYAVLTTEDGPREIDFNTTVWVDSDDPSTEFVWWWAT